MEGVKSPFRPASELPLQRNPPLAPSQELAYRNKCIQLKKRLQEVEANNDQTRRRIATEKERVQKQRLLRSILLHQLRDIMETPGRKFKPEELERLGIPIATSPDDPDGARGRPEGEMLLDDSSEDSDEDIPEPSDRPTRTRRQNNNYRGETVMSSTAAPIHPSAYQQSGLPAIAPATSYSPSAAREPLLTSSFQTPVAATAGSPQQYSSHQQSFGQDHRYVVSQPAHSSPAHTHTTIGGATVHHPITTHTQSRSASTSISHPQAEVAQNGYPARTASIPQPVHPPSPYDQFCEHMQPQLEADNYPPEHIQSRIDEEWRKLSEENRLLWHERYHEQMKEYEADMDLWKRAQRTQQGGTGSFRR